jgi:drug/metabolite transporter (DMT)-like permease
MVDSAIATPPARPLFGTVLVTLAAFGFAFMPVLATLVIAAGVDPAWLVAERFLPAAVLLLPAALAARREAGECARGFVVGAVMAVGTLGFFHGLQLVPIAHATVVYYTYPVFVLIWRRLLLGERPGATDEAGAALILAGALLVADPALGGAALWPGLVYCAAAPAAFGLVVLYVARPRRPIAPTARLAWTAIGTVVVMGAVAWWRTGGAAALPVDAVGWGQLALLVLATAFLPQLVFVVGAPWAGPGRTAVAGGLELPVAAVAGALILDDPFDWRVVAAVALMFMALRVSLPATRAPGR